jgi:hypothetical protein
LLLHRNVAKSSRSMLLEHDRSALQSAEQDHSHFSSR